MMKLQDKIAVVTGGGSGIGTEICRVFAAEGAKVAVTDVDLKTAEKSSWTPIPRQCQTANLAFTGA